MEDTETFRGRLKILGYAFLIFLLVIVGGPIWLIVFLSLSILSLLDLPIWIATGKRPITKFLEEMSS